MNIKGDTISLEEETTKSMLTTEDIFSTEDTDTNIKQIEEQPFKILMVGDEGVGKTCLVRQFVNKKNKEDGKSNICYTKILNISGDNIALQIWDFESKQQDTMMSRSYYEGCNAVIVVFDISDRTTYESVKGWLKDVGYYAPKDIIKYLVGNKTDLAANRIVSSQEAQDLAKREGFEFIETSTKSNNNVDILFQQIGRLLFQKNLVLSINTPQPFPKLKKKAKCCIIV
ncbi:Rab GTPase putative [Entamoeba histolytica]|uniref:Rab GTPase putative n=1 Tax=Entamoeba histolytica TaxID=5759 RepID=A0A175K0Q5_ENTHI|nr:Rab GTPase putative [Entamoeba histolytica]